METITPLQERIESVRLMEQNRSDIVESLRTVGVVGATENPPLSELAERIRWATGFGGCDVATIALRQEGKPQAFFKPEEWRTLPTVQKSNYDLIGVRFRAEARQWIIALRDATWNGNPAMQWCTRNGIAVGGMTSYNGNVETGLLSDFNGYGKTMILLEQASGSADIVNPAAEACGAFKATGNDETLWYLPDASEWTLMQQYKEQINAALAEFGSQFTNNAEYWTSDMFSSYDAWYVGTVGGLLLNNKNYSKYVRPCARVSAI